MFALDNIVPQLVIAGLLIKGVLSFLKWVMGDIADFIRFVKQWWATL